ncbi:transporter substrate-binding domain-containing protein, partial [bacterium]|nr:transporter substrate-binding domain-containing protein [bacterium]
MRSPKNIVLCILSVLLLALLSFQCLGILDTVSGVNIEGIKRRGKLIAVTSYGANSYFIYKGSFMGFEYDLLSMLARELGVKLEVRPTKDMDNIINMLNSGEGDLIAANIAVTKERTREFKFTDHVITTRQVLVQRKSSKKSNSSARLIRNPIDLIGRKIHVRKESRYFARLKNLSEEIGGDIEIVQVPGDVSIEELIKQVAEGEIDFTISDEPTAIINQLYYPNIDVFTPVSFRQRIAWIVRRKSPELLETVNRWIKKIRRNGSLDAIYKKYYRQNRIVAERMKVKYQSLSRGTISPYDTLIKSGADRIGWDWRLLVSLMYQESRFKQTARSWAGALGLMQLMPSTARHLGVRDPFNPRQNIEGGIRHLVYLNKVWRTEIKDDRERTKFVLASYNAGLGHIQDAQRLAEKYKKSPGL